MRLDLSKYPITKRIRHHKSSNFYLPLSELKKIPENYPPLYDIINWNDIFGNGKRPDVLDIGCGKGTFILSFAVGNPEINILGFDIRNELIKWINHIISEAKIPNCHTLFYCVANGLPFIESDTIQSVFYLFPDPWPKRKHNKRRAFNFELLDEIHRLLNENGKLYLATDVPEVDIYQKEVLQEHKGFDFEYVINDEKWNLPLTNKEIFCKEKKIPYIRMICNKTN